MSVERAVAVVRRAGGVARTRHLRRAGVSKRALARAVHSGRLIRGRTGVYTTPDASAALREALSHCGAIACVTAARDYGLWTLDQGEAETTHTWVDPGRHPTRFAVDPETSQPSCCVLHRDKPLDAPTVGRVGLVHCLRQLLACRGIETFFAALESALRRGLLDDAGRAVLRAALAEGDRWLVDFARSDADSGLESILRLRLHRHGISLASQVRIVGVGHVDFVIGDCLILEADGRTHDGDSRHTDRVRDAIAISLGFIPLRFDSAMILHDWPTVEAAILAALGRKLHRSRAGMTWHADRPID